MTSLKSRIIFAALVAGATGVAPVSIPRQSTTSGFGIREVHAAPAMKQYNSAVNPFAAGPGIEAIAKKAKSGSQLESARYLHGLLRIGNPGGLKVSESGASVKKDERPPRTAADVLHFINLRR